MSNAGRIENYNEQTGIGFVRADEGGELLPFSKSDMRKKGEAPWEKQPVRYEVEQDDEGDPRAVKLEQV